MIVVQDRKYYVVDSAYPNTLVPGLRYHLSNFRRGTPPQGMYEQFNYRHSSCWNVIKRVFAVLKNRWKVLKSMPQTDEANQLRWKLLLLVFTLHKFIRLHDLGIPFTHQIKVMEQSVTPPKSIHVYDYVASTLGVLLPRWNARLNKKER